MIEAPAHALCCETSMASRILLVDDNVSLLPAFSEALSHAGYAVVAASNGSQAELRAAVEPTFDLLITDYNMPGMTGMELASRLTQRQPDLPILLISGDKLDDLAAAILSSRRWRFLLKPISYAELISTVHQLVSTASSRILEMQHENLPRPPPNMGRRLIGHC
jgi:CheY-like chemotaxis protein